MVWERSEGGVGEEREWYERGVRVNNAVDGRYLMFIQFLGQSSTARN